MEYRVVWTIDIDADSFEDAAKRALEMHRDRESLATHFFVTDERGETREVWVERGP
jgi:hypothetical protein